MSPAEPDWRVSDTDRARSVEALGEHFAAGRLDADELEDRSGRALSARFRSDLTALFTDLPVSAPPAAVHPGHRSAFRWPMALVVLLPLVLVLHAWWLLVLLALFVVVRRARWRAERHGRRADQTSGRWRGVRGSAA